jgi:hypothetical protein
LPARRNQKCVRGGGGWMLLDEFDHILVSKLARVRLGKQPASQLRWRDVMCCLHESIYSPSHLFQCFSGNIIVPQKQLRNWCILYSSRVQHGLPTQVQNSSTEFRSNAIHDPWLVSIKDINPALSEFHQKPAGCTGR